MASAVVTAAYPSTHTLKDGGSDRQLCVPDESLLVASRGPLDVQQLAVALQAARQGCEGVSHFLALALTSSLKDTLVKTADPAVAV